MAGQLIRRGERAWLVRCYVGRVGGKRRYGSKLIHGTKKQAERALRAVLAFEQRHPHRGARGVLRQALRERETRTA